MRTMRLALLTTLALGWPGRSGLAQETWVPPATPDDVRLESEEMAKRGVVKIVARWVDGSVRPGAGMILDYRRGDLYLMTAAHVVRSQDLGGAEEIAVHFFGDTRERYRAELFRYDQDLDFAVLVVPGFFEERHLARIVKYPVAASFRSAAGGQPIKSVGHPGDRDWHVLRGTTLPSRRPDLLLFTAEATAPGSSGGPLLSADNRLVGMVRGGAGESGVGLALPALLRLLDAWGIPYRSRLVTDLAATVETIRSAVWNDDWDALRGVSLQSASHRAWRSTISVLAEPGAVIGRHFDDDDITYVEHLGEHGSEATLDEAWRLWLRELVAALGPGYQVEEKGRRRIAFSKYQGLAWPSSRRVTFELLATQGDVFLLVYRFETNVQDGLDVLAYRDLLQAVR